MKKSNFKYLIPVFITIGAGDIGVEISELKEKLSYAY